MNKKDLVEFIFEKLSSKVSRKVIGDVVTHAMDGVLHSVSKGQEVKLVGFIKIGLKQYTERKTRNPKTGEVFTTPASIRAVAKLGAMFKDATSKLKIIKAPKTEKKPTTTPVKKK